MHWYSSKLGAQNLFPYKCWVPRCQEISILIHFNHTPLYLHATSYSNYMTIWDVTMLVLTTPHLHLNHRIGSNYCQTSKVRFFLTVQFEYFLGYLVTCKGRIVSEMCWPVSKLYQTGLIVGPTRLTSIKTPLTPHVATNASAMWAKHDTKNN